jgi:transposase
MRFDLSDEEWSVLEPLMPKSRKSARPDDRRIINAIFYVSRTGIPWRDLPERYGRYTRAYNRSLFSCRINSYLDILYDRRFPQPDCEGHALTA